MKRELLGGLALTALCFPALGEAPKATVTVQSALDSRAVGMQESNLGDLVADAARESAQTDLAFVPADEFAETNIPAGAVAPAEIIRALRYAGDAADTVVVVKLTGAQILGAAERSVSRAPQPFDGFLQVSGLQMQSTSSQPAGQRLSLVGAGGSEISATHVYRVAMPRALAEGGLGYFQFWKKKDVERDTGTTLADSLTAYLAAHPTVAGKLDGRIVIR